MPHYGGAGVAQLVLARSLVVMAQQEVVLKSKETLIRMPINPTTSE